MRKVLVTCSTCLGTGVLFVHDELHPGRPPSWHSCNICESKGVIEAEEVSDNYVTEFRDTPTPPSLRSHELSREVKKMHLESMRLDPGQVEETLAKLYPPALDFSIPDCCCWLSLSG